MHKVFGKIQLSLMIKTLHKLIIEKIRFNAAKVIYASAQLKQ